MSKGSYVVPVRVPAELLAEVEATVKRSAHTRTGEPWTRSSFIIAALREKLSKMKRSNAPRRKKAAGGA